MIQRHFNQSEWNRVVERANERNNDLFGKPRVDLKAIDSRTSVERHVIGIASEVSVWEHAGGTWFHTTRGMIHPYDISAADGTLLEVKATEHVNGKFPIKRNERFVAQFGILCIVSASERIVRIVGVIDRDAFTKKREWQGDWTKPAWAVSQLDMDQPEESLARWGTGPNQRIRMTSSGPAVDAPEVTQPIEVLPVPEPQITRFPPNPYLRDFLATEEGKRLAFNLYRRNS